MIRAVVDTNVLVSGLLSSGGNEALIMLAIHHRLIRPSFSPEILTEYAEVLGRPKFAFSPDEITAALTMIRDAGELVVPQGPLPVLPDPDDARFLHCALMAKVEFLITGNKRHFPRAACDPVHVVSAGELLDRIAQDM